jgi:hypothetical protein
MNLLSFSHNSFNRKGWFECVVGKTRRQWGNTAHSWRVFIVTIESSCSPSPWYPTHTHTQSSEKSMLSAWTSMHETPYHWSLSPRCGSFVVSTLLYTGGVWKSSPLKQKSLCPFFSFSSPLASTHYRHCDTSPTDGYLFLTWRAWWRFVKARQVTTWHSSFIMDNHLLCANYRITAHSTM